MVDAEVSSPVSQLGRGKRGGLLTLGGQVAPGGGVRMRQSGRAIEGPQPAPRRADQEGALAEAPERGGQAASQRTPQRARRVRAGLRLIVG